MRGHKMRLPLFREVIFNNLLKSSKKPAEVSVRIYNTRDDLIYVTKDGNRRVVCGYTSYETGLFIMDIKDVEASNTHHPYAMFRDEAARFAQKAIDEKIKSLMEFRSANTEDFDLMYKPIPKIVEELDAYMTDRHLFHVDIQKQIDVMLSQPLPHVNEYLVYEDDKLSRDRVVTQRVPYKNPKNQTLTNEQAELVDKFLDVFVDEYNKDVLSWYFGAILLNIPLQDARVSKILVVSSSNGGSGKSTLISALANGVVTTPYRVIDSGFDKHFKINDKFNTSNLPTCRLGIYSEAYFNSDSREGLPHDFSGLDESELKSWITEGYVSNEKKFADRQISKLTGMQIILTNHPPQINEDRRDLKRRFLSLVVKPSDMVKDKAKELNMTEKQLFAYVKENAQAFANYFVNSFKSDPNRYRSTLYSTDEVIEDITQSQMDYLKQKEVEKSELTEQGAIVLLTSLCKQYDIPYESFIEALMAERQKMTRDDIRWTEDVLYISSKKTFFVGFKIIQLRDALKDIVGDPVKKYGQRMFALPIK